MARLPVALRPALLTAVATPRVPVVVEVVVDHTLIIVPRTVAAAVAV